MRLRTVLAITDLSSHPTLMKDRRQPAARLVIGLGILLALLLVTISISIVVARRDGKLFDAANELRTLDLLLAGETDRSFQSVRLVLDGVAAQLAAPGPLSAQTLEERGSSRAVHADLRARLSGLPQLDAVTIVAANGRILNYSREWPVRYWNLSDRPYFQEMANTPGDRPLLSEPLIDRFTKKPTIYLVRRLNDPNGRFLGIVIGAIKLGYFDRFYESLHLTAGEFIALRRGDGKLITHFPVVEASRVPDRVDLPTERGKHGVDGVFDVVGTLKDGSRPRRIVASTVTSDMRIRVDIGRDEAGLLDGWRSEAIAVGVANLMIIALLAVLLWSLLRRWHALELATQASLHRAQAVLAQRDLKEALLQAQKMDAMGQLAGGIAHDFNNMLTVIGGGLDMLRRKLGPSDPAIERCISNSEEGVRRATALTARLLSFARKQEVQTVAIDVNDIVAGLTELLDRTLGGGITVETHRDAALWQARGDASQLENAILNLCVNARDAMPEGGSLGISTANVDLAQGDLRAIDLPAGDYVEISVSDTGSGMSPEVAARIFEPFFTTKGVGLGTGLGLAQVFAFARDVGGSVKVQTEIDVGTTFRVYLPRDRD